MTSVVERQADRLRLLLALYEAVDADTHARINYRGLPSGGRSEQETAKSIQYLVDEGLAEWAALGGMLAITHRGIREAEAALQEHPTDHFSAPAVNIVVVGDGSSVGGVQQGTVLSSQQVEHHATLTPVERLALRGWLASEEAAAAREAGEKAAEAVEILEATLADESGDRSTAERALSALKEVLLGTAGGAAWTGLQALAELVL
jgi:hypothetical protein